MLGQKKSVSCLYTLSMDTSRKSKVGLCDASLSSVFSAQQFSTPRHLEVDAVSTYLISLSVEASLKTM